MFKNTNKTISSFVAMIFCLELIAPNPAQAAGREPYAPLSPGEGLTRVSRNYASPVLKGLRLDPQNPLHIEFLIDTGDKGHADQAEIGRLIRYFLAGLAIPKRDIWVNLSPYEKNRIIASGLEATDLGKDLLGQDYLLKQLAASLTYPESEAGKKYWDEINNPNRSLSEPRPSIRSANGRNTQGAARIETTQSFNKVWVTPREAEVYESKTAVLVTAARLKVLTEEDYLACRHAYRQAGQEGLAIQKNGRFDTSPSTDAFKKHILPLIEKDINEGENFSQLRQIYYSLILAVWFKETFEKTLYKHYIDKAKVAGIDIAEKGAKEKIYNRYVEAFNKGAYNYVKRERVETQKFAALQKITKRRFFSGGMSLIGEAGDFSPVRVSRLPQPESFGPLLKVGSDMREAPQGAILVPVSQSGHGYHFPRWLRAGLEQRFSELAGEQAQVAVEFLSHQGGVVFSGKVSDVPEPLRAILQPREYVPGIVVCEAAASKAAVLLKEILPRYDTAPVQDAKKDFLEAAVYQQTTLVRIRDCGEDFSRLEAALADRLGQAGVEQFIAALVRQYDYTDKTHRDIFSQFTAQLITEIVRFGRLPQAIQGVETGFKEMDIDEGILKAFAETIARGNFMPSGEARQAVVEKFNSLIAAQEFKYKLSDKVDTLFSGLPREFTSTEQESDFYQRAQKAFVKTQGLDHYHEWDFQNRDVFSRRGQTPLAPSSLKRMETLYKKISIRYPALLPAVVSFMDIAKVTKFKTDPRYKNLNFANHPQAGARILEDQRVFEGLGFSPELCRLAIALVGEHGFIGQAKRGEVTSEVFEPILDFAINHRDPDVIAAYFLVNAIDAALVFEGRFSEDFFQWFYAKYQELESLALKGIEQGKSAKEILAQEGKIESTDYNRIDYAARRFLAMRPGTSLVQAKDAIKAVFAGAPSAQEEFTDLMSRQENSFSFWYPETALGWLDIHSQIKALYLSLKLAEHKAEKRKAPIDINFFRIAQEADRRDDQRLREESRQYLAGVFNNLTVEDILREKFLDTVSRQGLNGVEFTFDAANNALYAGIDPLAPLHTTVVQARERIAVLEEQSAQITPGGLFFVKDNGKQDHAKVGVMMADFSPFQARHKAMIEEAMRSYNLDEIILVVPKEKSGSKDNSATLAERLYLMEQEVGALPKVSLAVCDGSNLRKVVDGVHSARSADMVYTIVDHNDFVRIFDEERSEYTPADRSELFGGKNRMLVAPHGIFKAEHIKQVLIENEAIAYDRYVYPLAVPREYLFDTGTQVRQNIRNFIPDNKMVSIGTLRTIQALGLYHEKESIDSGVAAKAPMKITFVNLTSPRHKVISAPQGIEALTGDLRTTFGTEVAVNTVDAQYGMDAALVVEELRRIQPDVIGLSAQLESDKKLFAVLDIIKDDPWFKAAKPQVLVGNNLPTNENKEILKRYPFVITVRGEGEYAMREIVRYRRGQISIQDIPAASYIKDGKIVENQGVLVSVEDLGVPSRDSMIEVLKRGGDIWIETSRGCGWGKCAFCFKDPYRAHKWQPFPAEVVLEAFERLLQLSAELGIPQVSLADPEFFGGGEETMRGMERARQIAEGLIKLNKKYGRKLNIAFSLRADSVYREPKGTPERIARVTRENAYKVETLKLLKEAGFRNPFLGTEAGSDRLLRLYRKGVTARENAEAIHILQGLGYKVCCGYIPLAPDAVVDDVKKNCQFIRDNNLYMEISFPLNQLKVQPGTEYYTRTLAQGLLGKRRVSLHTFNARYKDPDVQKIADIIDFYAREIGSVFYVLKYMYRSKDLNAVIGEEGERAALAGFFLRYNRMEVDFLATIADNITDPVKLAEQINLFRRARLNLVLELEAVIHQGAIKDENGLLRAEIEAIRPLLNKFTSGQLAGIPALSAAGFAAMDKNPTARLREVTSDPDFAGSRDKLEAVVVLAEKIKKTGNFVRVDLPASRPSRVLGLYIRMSDDLTTVSYYRVKPDIAGYRTPEEIKPGDLEPILENVPSFGLVFPENYIYQKYPKDTVAVLTALYRQGGVYSEYRGVITDMDAQTDVDVWGFNADTANFIDVLTSHGVFERGDINTLLEINAGGGPIAKTAVQHLGGLGLKQIDLTDISPHALMAQKRNLQAACDERGVVFDTYLGRGIKDYPHESHHRADCVLVSAPYLAVLPELRSPDDPSAGTGLIKEVIEEGINSLNPDNPHADIIMSYSSLADHELQEYLRAYGQLVDVEVLDQGRLVPLKIEKADARWVEWMKGRGLTVKDDAMPHEFKYWHKLKVVRIKPKQIALAYRDGSSAATALSVDMFSRENFSRHNLNGLALRDKLKLLTLLSPQREPWFDSEWHELYSLVDYYRNRRLPALRQAVEGQLNRPVSLSAANLLEVFYEPGRFMDGNIIRTIYFGGREPRIVQSVIDAYRDGLNAMDQSQKQTLIRLFEEQFEAFGWSSGLEQALASYGYGSAFKIVDISDTSVGAGVYKLTLQVNTGSGSALLELFLKKDRFGAGLVNEGPYIDLQREHVAIAQGQPEQIPFHYRNPDRSKPDLLIAMPILKTSLDAKLTESRAITEHKEQVIRDAEVQGKADIVKTTPVEIRSRIAAAQEQLASSDDQERRAAVENLSALKGYIKRGKALAGFADMHAHTNKSDGILTPAQLVFRAWLNSARAITITDHMTFGGVVEAMETAQALGDIEVLPGIEVYAQETELGMPMVHATVHFPAIKNAQAFKEFLQRLETGHDPQYQVLHDIFVVRVENVELIRRAFNELFSGEGLEITSEDIARLDHALPVLPELAGILKAKYEKKFYHMSQENIREAYIEKAKHQLPSPGKIAIEFSDLCRFAAHYGGMVFVAHALRYADDSNIDAMITKYEALFNKYAAVTVGGKKLFGLRGLGLYGSSVKPEYSQKVLAMLERLKKRPLFASFPPLVLHESDYHGKPDRELVLGQKHSDGAYHAAPYYATVLDMRKQAAAMAKIGSLPADESNYPRVTRVAEQFTQDATMALVEEKAWDDLIGRNDRSLGNIRTSTKEDGSLDALVAFDVPNMLDEEAGVPDGWYLNYDWGLEDVKQGVDQLNVLTLHAGYAADTGKADLAQRLKQRVALFKQYRNDYRNYWEKFVNRRAEIEAKIKRRYDAQTSPGKLQVLDQWLRWNAGHPEEYFKMNVRALLEDYEMRSLYAACLDAVYQKVGAKVLGYLAKYCSVFSNGYVSSRMERFRGILTRDFLARRGIKGRKSIEEVYREIEEYAREYLGADAVDQLHAGVKRVKAEADFVMAEVFDDLPGNPGGMIFEAVKVKRRPGSMVIEWDPFKDKDPRGLVFTITDVVPISFESFLAEPSARRVALY